MPAPPPNGMSSTCAAAQRRVLANSRRTPARARGERVGDVALGREPRKPLGKQREDVNLHRRLPRRSSRRGRAARLPAAWPTRAPGRGTAPSTSMRRARDVDAADRVFDQRHQQRLGAAGSPSTSIASHDGSSISRLTVPSRRSPSNTSQRSSSCAHHSPSPSCGAPARGDASAARRVAASAASRSSTPCRRTIGRASVPERRTISALRSRHADARTERQQARERRRSRRSCRRGRARGPTRPAGSSAGGSLTSPRLERRLARTPGARSIDDVDEHMAALAGRCGFDDRAQRVRGASAAADHPAVVVGADAQLEHDRSVDRPSNCSTETSSGSSTRPSARYSSSRLGTSLCA